MSIEKETTILDFDFGFTAVDADELEVVQQAKEQVETTSASAQQNAAKAQLIYDAVVPLLNNLKANPEKDYIYWPNRLERVEKFEKDVKAWAHFDKKLLLEKAEEADQHRRSGKPTGPLHGIPIALKDIIGTVDMPTECGTPIRKGKSYSQNAEIVDLLLSAGAIVMGKTATSELAYLGPSKTTNPHDHSRTPGGSSSGSAASVGAFMAPLSIGSQTGGSVIITSSEY